MIKASVGYSETILCGEVVSKFVLVTGASSGIGAATIEHLDQQGFSVLAGVRKEIDANKITQRFGGRITPLIIDVTQQETIDAAKEKVQDIVAECGLAGLVNNAGIVETGPLECLPMAKVRRQFEVNVFGQLSITQSFMRLLKLPGDARIVNVSSVSGFVAFPMVGPYAASKFALEALSDSLRLELRSSGIKVILIQPGVVKTPIWDLSPNETEQNWPRLDERENQRYQGMSDNVLGMQNTPKPSTPGKVAEVICKALTMEKPKPRYLVGRDARNAAFFLRPLSTQIRDRIVRAALRRSEKKSRK